MSEQLPTVGRIVHYYQDDSAAKINGTRMHPAIITRVWGPSCVNLMVFFDGAAPGPVTSVCRNECPPDTLNTSSHWDWPSRA